MTRTVQNANFEVHVCLRCPSPDAARRNRDEGGGPALLAAIQAELARRPYAPYAVLLAYQCLGVCTTRGRVSLAAYGRWGVVLGGIDENLDIPALGDYINLWLLHPWGEIPKPLRLASMEKKIIGRLPPHRHDQNHAAAEFGGPQTNQKITRVPLVPPAYMEDHVK